MPSGFGKSTFTRQLKDKQYSAKYAVTNSNQISALLLIISPEDNFVSVFNSTGRMKLSISALVSILASGANAQVVNPCLICRDGATAGDDFAPYAADGLNATCADLMKEIKVFEDGSEECGWFGFEDIKSACCPTTPPENPCMVCSDGITATDDFAPYADWGNNTTCNELVLLSEAGSELCSNQELDLIFCCPTAAENPCIVCPDGATAGETMHHLQSMMRTLQLARKVLKFSTSLKKSLKSADWGSFS